MPSLLRVQPSFNRDVYAETMTEGFFNLLDRDHDGKLSKQELANAEKLLPLFDRNEDECLAALEIVPNLFARPRMVGATPTVNAILPKSRAATETETLQFFKVGEVPDTLIEPILLRYDKDKNYRLSKAESGFDDATFAKLDKNGNGELTVTELLAWRDLPPDLEISLTFGSNQTDCSAHLLPGPDGKPAALAGYVKFADNAKSVIHVGTQQIDLRVFSTPRLVNAAIQMQPIFNFADPDNRGYITENQLVGPQFQLLRIIFDIVDRNGDGKMTRQEYDDFFAMQQSFTNLPLALTHLTQTPSLFSILDVDGDGRLSVRELRSAWNRLKVLEPGGGEFITRSALTAARERHLYARQLCRPRLWQRQLQPSCLLPTQGPGLVPEDGPKRRRRRLTPNFPVDLKSSTSSTLTTMA